MPRPDGGHIKAGPLVAADQPFLTNGDHVDVACDITANSFKAWMQRHDEMARTLLAGQRRMEDALRDAVGMGRCSNFTSKVSCELDPGLSTMASLTRPGVAQNIRDDPPLRPPMGDASEGNVGSGAEWIGGDSTTVCKRASLADQNGASVKISQMRHQIRKNQRKRRYSTSQVLDTSIMDSAPKDGEGFVTRLLHSRFSEMFCLSLVWANAVYIGVQVEYKASTNTELPLTYEFDMCFAVVFTLELVLKCYVDRLQVCVGPDRGWHFFDFFVVAMMWTELIINMLGVDNKSSSGVSVLRIIRCARVVRVARVIRTLSSFHELRLMILSLLRSAAGIVWIVAVLIIFMYMFAVSLAQGSLDYCANSQRERLSPEMSPLCRYWGSVWWAMLSLYEGMTGGISWGELLDALQPLGGFYMVIFLIYVTLSIFVVSNIITGIFVDEAMQAAKQDQDSVIREEMSRQEGCVDGMHKVFTALDTDLDGQLTIEEFEAAITDHRLVTYLSVLGLEVNDAQAVYCLIDHDKTGDVDIEEFIVGCLRLKGEARSLDLAMIQMQNEWLVDRVESIALHVQSLHQLVTAVRQ